MVHFHNEFTMTFYLVDAAHSCKITIRVLTEDTDVLSDWYVGCIRRRWSAR